MAFWASCQREQGRLQVVMFQSSMERNGSVDNVKTRYQASLVKTKGMKSTEGYCDGALYTSHRLWEQNGHTLWEVCKFKKCMITSPIIKHVLRAPK